MIALATQPDPICVFLGLSRRSEAHFSLHFTGGRKGPLGPTGTPTAHGVHIAVKQAARFLWGSESLEGKKIVVQGLGAVGFPLAEDYIHDGAKLVICDVDPAKIAELKEKYPKASIEVVEPSNVLKVEADIFSPCAMGGVLNEDNIPGLKFKIVMGSANNALKASSQEEVYTSRFAGETRDIIPSRMGP